MAPLPFARDAAIVVGLAGTALAFASSPDDEVERWLRPLRLYGDSAVALQGLAIGEAPLTEAASPVQEINACPPDRTVELIVAAASKLAAERGSAWVGTVDLLIAVMRHYPDGFERALRNRGSDGAELVERLAQTFGGPLH